MSWATLLFIVCLSWTESIRFHHAIVRSSQWPSLKTTGNSDFYFRIYPYGTVYPVYFRFILAGLGSGAIVVFNVDFNKWHHDYENRYTQRSS